MSPPERKLLRKLADWPTDGDPVTMLYVDVDGRRHPRRADYVVRADDDGSRVDSVASAELERLGGIGALLRF